MSIYNQNSEKSLKELLTYVHNNHHNPSAAFYASEQALEAVSNGELSLFDPTSPTAFLLEVASVAASASITEAVQLLRVKYPNLAETETDLYNHMNDWDYLDRFASPVTEKIGFLLGANTLLSEMIYDPLEKAKKAIIPRDTEVYFGDICFTLMYPIVIRYHDTGTLSVSYDASQPSKFQQLETNIIQYEARTMPDGAQFLYFEIPMIQVKIQQVNNVIQRGRPLVMDVELTDQFYHCRGFYRNQSTDNQWKEMITTHSEMVYDPRTPTLVLKLNENILTASIPQVYLSDSSFLGEVKLYVYTTKGNINENLQPLESKVDLRSLDPDELTVYTTSAMINVPRTVISNAITTGGRNSLNFEQLRSRVIENSIGEQKLPITNVELEEAVDKKGFDLVKNIDVVTNRVFLATQKLPEPLNKRLITAANIGIETLILKLEDILQHPYFKINDLRWTISPKCLFKQENGILSIVSKDELEALEYMERTLFVNHMNDSTYLYTPFHWVVDNSSLELSLRAYYIDKPQISPINFRSQNQSLQLAVNTAYRRIERTEQGFRIVIRTRSQNHYKALPDQNVCAQLMFYPADNSIPVYLKGYQSGIVDGEREFSFDIKTNFDFNADDHIRILDVDIVGSVGFDIWANLDTEFHIFLCTDSRVSGYLPDSSNDYYGEFQLPAGMVPITHESVKVTLGKALKNLWSRARNLAVGVAYETHETDVQARYTEDVYDLDPITGKPFTIIDGKPVFNIKHRAGELVFTEDNEPVYLFIKGTPVIDIATGLPKPLPEKAEYKELDILMIDGRHYFVNDKAYIDYNQELVDVLVNWITEDLYSVSLRLLEQTKLYFHPKSQLGYCQLEKGDGAIVNIDSEQSPILDLYVYENVFKDTDLRQQIQDKIIRLLDQLLDSRELNNSFIEKEIINLVGDAVKSVRLKGLGGEHDIQYGVTVSPTKKLCLKRILQIQADGTLIMKEDVKFNFIRIDN